MPLLLKHVCTPVAIREVIDRRIAFSGLAPAFAAELRPATAFALRTAAVSPSACASPPFVLSAARPVSCPDLVAPAHPLVADARSAVLSGRLVSTLISPGEEEGGAEARVCYRKAKTGKHLLYVFSAGPRLGAAALPPVDSNARGILVMGSTEAIVCS